MFSVVGAGLRSDIRSQKSDIRCGTSWFHALQRLRSKPNILSRRGGSLRPPEQSSGRKQLVSVIKIVILISAVTDWKNQLSCGRAQRPAPTTAALLFRVATAVWNHPARILSAEYRPRLPWVFFPFSVFFECVIGDVIPSVLKLRLIADDSVVKAPLPKR